MKKDNRRTVSRMSPYETALMGISSEYLMARTLGCHFDPRSFKGGDGHRKDLWRGFVTLSVKTRHAHLPSDFLFPPGQEPKGFPDDYGVVGRWTKPYVELDVVGFFDRADWQQNFTTIKATGVPEGRNPYRTGYPAECLRPIEELLFELDMVEDEKIRAIQDKGYLRHFGDWYRSRGDSV